MILIIYNPVSGISANDLNYIEDMLVKRLINFDLLVTENEHSVQDYLSKTEEKYDTIVVAGGDGTISQVIQEFINNDIESKLLVYPRGTTNEYAASLGINKMTFERYLNGDTEVIPVDVGLFNDGGVFTYSFVFGNFSHVPYETPQWLKSKLGYIAYWIYAFFTLYIFRLKRYEMSFSYNDKVIEGKFLFGSISNSETLGKVIRLNDVSFSDGLLEVFLVMAPKSLGDLTRFLHDARTGNDTSGLIIHDKVRSVDIKSPVVHSWSADGEFSGTFDTLNVRISDKSIKSIV